MTRPFCVVRAGCSPLLNHPSAADPVPSRREHDCDREDSLNVEWVRRAPAVTVHGLCTGILHDDRDQPPLKLRRSAGALAKAEAHEDREGRWLPDSLRGHRDLRAPRDWPVVPCLLSRRIPHPLVQEHAVERAAPAPRARSRSRRGATARTAVRPRLSRYPIIGRPSLCRNTPPGASIAATLVIASISSTSSK